jgi:hypothetical protein
MESLFFVFKGHNSDQLHAASYGEPQGSTAHVWQGNVGPAMQLGRFSTASMQDPVACWHAALRRLYVVYRHTATKELRHGYYDGHAWYDRGVILVSDSSTTRARTDQRPGLTLFHDELWLAYKRADSSSIFWVFMGLDGRWHGNAEVKQPDGRAPLTNEGVELVTFKNGVYLLSKEFKSNTLFSCRFWGGQWRDLSPIERPKDHWQAASRRGPRGAVFRERLYVCYVHPETDELHMAVHNGEQWSDNTPIDVPGTARPKSDFAPGMGVYDKKLMLVYTEVRGSNLFTASYDGRVWSGNVAIRTQAGQISPMSDRNPSLNVTPFPVLGLNNWLQHVPGTMPIGEINLPGTHDTAAINPTGNHDLYACHQHSIEQQLNNGMRVLDIRIQVEDGKHDDFEFYTCHGNLSFSWAEIPAGITTQVWRKIRVNRYEPLKQALDTCKAFLQKNPSEFLAISLQIDDWHTKREAEAINALRALINTYEPFDWSTTLPSMPTKEDVQKKFVLFNRIGSPGFGLELAWTKNTNWEEHGSTPARNFPYMVQDHFQLSGQTKPGEWKRTAFRQAIDKVKGGTGPFLLLNFASSVSGLTGVYIQDDVVKGFNGKAGGLRPASRLGWSLYDYEDQRVGANPYYHPGLTVGELIIASNFQYAGYEWSFDG